MFLDGLINPQREGVTDFWLQLNGLWLDEYRMDDSMSYMPEWGCFNCCSRYCIFFSDGIASKSTSRAASGDGKKGAVGALAGNFLLSTVVRDNSLDTIET